MPSTRSARRGETQNVKKERMQRQRDRDAVRMLAPPRPASRTEQDMLSLFGSIMHAVHCATRQAKTASRTLPPGQWLLTDALNNSPDGLRPENIHPLNNNAGGSRDDRIAEMSDAIADAASRVADPQVLFFLDLIVKAEKAVAQAEEARGSPINHLGAYLKAFTRDVSSWAGRKLNEGRNGSDTETPDLRSTNSASAAELSEPQSAGQTPAAAAATTTTTTTTTTITTTTITLTASSQPQVLGTANIGRRQAHSFAASNGHTAPSSNAAMAQPAAKILPPPTRPRAAQPQKKTIQAKAKCSLIVRLKVSTFPGGNNPSTGSSMITTAAAQPHLASSDVVASAKPTAPVRSGLTIKLRPNAGKPKPQQSATTTQSASETVAANMKRGASEEPTVSGPPASKKTRTSQEASSASTATMQGVTAPVRRSGRKAPIVVPSQPQVNADPQQESSNTGNKPVQPSNSLSEATGSSVSGARKRKARTGEDSDDEFVAEQPKKRRRAAAPHSTANKATSKAPRTTAVKKSTKTAKPSTITAVAASASAPATAPAPTPAPAPAPTPALPPAAPQLRQRNGPGPVTGRNGFELISPEPIFVVGQNDAPLLTLEFYRNDEAGNRICDSHTWAGKNDGRTAADIDWNDRVEIKNLNKWFNQYLKRTWQCAGLRPDMMMRVWMEEEFEWLANQARHYRSWGKKTPSGDERRDEFNEEWEGEQIPYMNMAGEEVLTMPRPERTWPAIQSAARRDEAVHPARWVGTYLEGATQAKKKNKAREEAERKRRRMRRTRRTRTRSCSSDIRRNHGCCNRV